MADKVKEELLGYYERELAYLREMGAEFARKYPKIAGRLLLEEDTCEDPHVERLLQGFAFLTARVGRKLDDEFSELSQALLSLLYPAFLAPIPAMSIVQFVVDPESGPLNLGYVIDRGTMLYSQPIDGMSCQFRTCYPVTLWPLAVAAARVEETDQGLVPGAVAAVRLELRATAGITWAELRVDQLRFYLQGQNQLVYRLYEVLLNNCIGIHVLPFAMNQPVTAIPLPASKLQPAGFGAEETMFPGPVHSFPAHRLLQEYFACPRKFLFVDLQGLESACRPGVGDRVDIIIFLNRRPSLDHAITAGTFQLGCTPIVNLFPKVAEPILLTHAQTEYHVIPDLTLMDALEVYSIDDVLGTSPLMEEPIAYSPLYSFKHRDEGGSRNAFWHATRRPSLRREDAGTEVYVSVVDVQNRPKLASGENLTIHVTCTNRDLPNRLMFGREARDFELDREAPIKRISGLIKPTDTLRPVLTGSTQWRLISHLALNQLSLCEGGSEALQEVLQLYEFADSVAIKRQIAGIIGVESRRVIRRLPSGSPGSFCRGLEVTVEFDEDHFVGSGVFLFSAVLERFLGEAMTLNTFLEFVARTKQREGPLKRWPPRAGEQLIV